MKKSPIYPNEGFVVESVAKYFTSQGFITTFAQNNLEADLVAINDQDKYDCWIIEAKGHTASITTDHNTALGQILKRMSDDNKKYAIAVPRTTQLERECRKVPLRIKELLGLHFIFVDEEGHISIVAPNAQI